MAWQLPLDPGTASSRYGIDAKTKHISWTSYLLFTHEHSSVASWPSFVTLHLAHLGPEYVLWGIFPFVCVIWRSYSDVHVYIYICEWVIQNSNSNKNLLFIFFEGPFNFLHCWNTALSSHTLSQTAWSTVAECTVLAVFCLHSIHLTVITYCSL